MKNLRQMLCYLGLLLGFWGQTTGQNSEALYRIYDVQEGRETTLDAVIKAMARYDVLFVGEEHNDSVAHYLQLELLRRLHGAYGASTALSMEMFDRDAQFIMDEYLGGHIQEKHFVKAARVWNNYADYRPMVEFARENRLPVICANAGNRYTNLVSREGAKALERLPKSSRHAFAPLPYALAEGRYYEKLAGFMGANPHEGGITETARNFIAAQSLWDATMAYSIAQFLRQNKRSKVMQVNGRFHSDERLGTVAQLRRYAPKARVLVVSIGSDERYPSIPWAEHTHLGDFIIITNPTTPRTY